MKLNNAEAGWSTICLLSLLTAVALTALSAGPEAQAHRGQARDYSDTYAKTPNATCFPVLAKDCTNFVSQAMWAGGLDMIAAGPDEWCCRKALLGCL